MHVLSKRHNVGTTSITTRICLCDIASRLAH